MFLAEFNQTHIKSDKIPIQFFSLLQFYYFVIEKQIRIGDWDLGFFLKRVSRSMNHFNENHLNPSQQRFQRSKNSSRRGNRLKMNNGNWNSKMNCVRIESLDKWCCFIINCICIHLRKYHCKSMSLFFLSFSFSLFSSLSLSLSLSMKEIHFKKK